MYLDSGCDIVMVPGGSFLAAMTFNYSGTGTVRLSSSEPVDVGSFVFWSPQAHVVLQNFNVTSSTALNLIALAARFDIIDTWIYLAAPWTLRPVQQLNVLRSQVVSTSSAGYWTSDPLDTNMEINIEDSNFVATSSGAFMAFKTTSGRFSARNSAFNSWRIESSLDDHILDNVLWQLRSTYPLLKALTASSSEPMGSLTISSSTISARPGSAPGAAVTILGPNIAINNFEVVNSNVSFPLTSGATGNDVRQLLLRNVTTHNLAANFVVIASNTSTAPLSVTVTDCDIESGFDILNIRSNASNPYNLNISPSTNLKSTASAITLGGSINLVTSLTLSHLSLSEDTTLTGESLELSGLSSTGYALHLNTSSATLHPFTSLQASISISTETDLIYVPEGVSLGLQVEKLATASFGIDWRLPSLPSVSIPYLLSTNTPDGVSYHDHTGNNEYDVSTSWEVATGSTLFSFNPVPCDSRCLPSHLSILECSSRLKCSCALSWTGDFCECDQTGLISGTVCSVRGAIWNHTGDLITTSGISTNVPVNHTLIVEGDATINGNLTLPGASLSVSGQASVNAGIKLSGKLRELRQSAGCIVYSTVHIYVEEALQIASNGIIEVELDVSELSLDGSCIPPQDSSMDGLVSPLIVSKGAVNMASSSQWNIKLSGGASQNISLLLFTTRLLASGSGSSGTSQHVNLEISSDVLCSEVVQSPVGSMTLNVGCLPPSFNTNPPSIIPTDSSTIPTGASSSQVASLALLIVTCLLSIFV
jgi:hypothetical protein